MAPIMYAKESVYREEVPDNRRLDENNIPCCCPCFTILLTVRLDPLQKPYSLVNEKEETD